MSSQCSTPRLSLTFDGHGHRFHLAAQHRVAILLLPESRYGHASGEESDVPQERKAHGESTVRAEDLDGGEWTDDADPEGYHVRQGGYRDGHGSLGHGLGHSSLHGPFRGGPPPSGQHDECVVDSDTWGTVKWGALLN